MPPNDPLRRDQPLKPSVLDRLLVQDDDGRGSNTTQLLRDVRESVRRDLEDLLNTRPRFASWPSCLNELDESLANYGLPDFTGANLSAPRNHQQFCYELQRLIETFEPRLENVRVQKLSKGEPVTRVLSFRIEATLRVHPLEESIVFDSTIEPVSATFAVKRTER